MTDKRLKSHQLTVRLEPKIYDALSEVGMRIGVKPSVLAGLAIGDYVTKSQASYGAFTTTQEMMVKEMAKGLTQHMTTLLTIEQMEKLIQE